MDAQRLIGSLIQGALSSKKKRRRGAVRFLTGGRNSFLNASTLLTVAGVVWGLYESTQEKPSDASGGSRGTVAPPASVKPWQQPHLTVEPQKDASIPDNLRRLIRLTISAARADGNLSAGERNQILEHVRDSGATAVIEEELQRTWPLAEIVSGIEDPAVRADLYTLAFTIVRADEGVSGAERIYLFQLAHELGLDQATTARLEEEAVARIDQESGG